MLQSAIIIIAISSCVIINKKPHDVCPALHCTTQATNNNNKKAKKKE